MCLSGLITLTVGSSTYSGYFVGWQTFSLPLYKATRRGRAGSLGARGQSD